MECQGPAVNPTLRNSNTIVKEVNMSDWLVWLLVLGAWFVIQGWLLPKLGVST